MESTVEMPEGSKNVTRILEQGSSNTFSSNEIPTSSWTILIKRLQQARRCVRFSHNTEEQKWKNGYVITKAEDVPAGFPRLAAYFTIDKGLRIFRAFHELWARVLLDKQEVIADIENQLKHADNRDHNGDAESRLCLGSRIQDEQRDLLRPAQNSRQQLIRTAEKELLEYATLLEKGQMLLEMKAPSRRDYRTVRNMVSSPELQLGDDLRETMRHVHDFVSLQPQQQDHAWLDDGIESLIIKLPYRLMKWPFAAKAKEQGKGKEVRRYSRKRLGRCNTLIILGLMLVLLLAPICVLRYFLDRYGPSDSFQYLIPTFAVSTILFASLSLVFTTARRHEVLAASASYCAVLVVFVSFSGSSTAIGPPPN